ncbi:MAG TPA: hypothetical protein QF887_17640, partial [SAR324 cluster bacterium]|nr:hypothetical protein [SAR324 cluster bacterium]
GGSVCGMYRYLGRQGAVCRHDLERQSLIQIFLGLNFSFLNNTVPPSGNGSCIHDPLILPPNSKTWFGSWTSSPPIPDQQAFPD